MRKITHTDLTSIAGSTVKGYLIGGVRIKRGTLPDSGNYGIILGWNQNDNYVTWEFTIDDEKVNPYWGHYFEKRDDAMADYENRDLYENKKFTVTITETLKLNVEVESCDECAAEQIVSDNWRKSEYVLDAENFTGVEFKAVPYGTDENQETV